MLTCDLIVVANLLVIVKKIVKKLLALDCCISERTVCLIQTSESELSVYLKWRKQTDNYEFIDSTGNCET